MRLFVALTVSPEAVAALAASREPLVARHDDANWTSQDTWHVTLAFIGEVDDDRLGDVVAAVRDAVARATATPRRLRFGEPGRFGRRVLWMGVEDVPTGAVALLGLVVQEALRDRGIPVDAKPVVPHVTLARARGRKGQLPSGIVGEMPAVDAAWGVSEVHVVRSHLGPEVHHETVVTVALG